jgi:exodeoxyribonuclease V gamma subunit
MLRAMLHLHLSNRVEALADALLQALAGTREDPFAAEQVIVPSAGMKRWLTLRMADAMGVCAQVQFDYLASWLWTLLRHRCEAGGRSSPGLALTPPVLAWQLWRLLGDAAFVAQQPRLAAYLADADQVMRWELAERVAALLDQVLGYRADWIETWSAGRPVALAGDAPGDQAWQAALWRRVAAELGLGRQHPLAELAEVGPRELPAALHLFALPSLAPLHAEALQALARHTEVHVWALNPCREYWFELIPPRLFGRLAGHASAGAEVGHPLLAGWGRQTQAAIDTLLDRCPDALLDDGSYEPLVGDSLLAQLHNGILELTPPAPGTLRLAAGDRSIEVHRCHSLARELEVLHDRLLGLLREAESAGAPLHPGRIVVVTPDLAAAAPLIDAVFGTVSAPRRIPYTISGLGSRQSSAPARVLLALLALVASRAPASELFALLHEPLVAGRFGLDDEALERIECWLVEAGLHGGIDAAHRAAQGVLVSGSRHTLADALERLLLGHLLPDDVAEPFAGLLGCGGADGSEALALGALARYAEALQRFERASAAAQAAERWRTLLHGALDVFVTPEPAEPDDVAALQELRRQIDGWAALLHAGGVDGSAPLTLALVRHTLGLALDEPARGGVAGGGVTFAAMSSLRNLPFDVVCAIGLDGTAFPASSAVAEFDLLAAAPRRGDRQRRLDDRNLFLDLLLAARSHLHLSCTARSARDNTELPPSVLVLELLDVLVDGLAPPLADAAERERWRARLVVDHPLQAFAHAPFLAGSEARQRSHDADLARALQAALGAAAAPAAAAGAADAAAPNDASDLTGDEGEGADDDEALAVAGPPFFSRPLAAPGPEWRDPSLDDLVRFFANPSRHLLRQRLQLAPLRDADELDDTEPALLDRVAERRLAVRLLPRLLAGASDAALAELALAGPEVPAGALGRHQLGDWLLELRTFGSRVRTATAAPCRPACDVDFEASIDGERWALQTRLPDLRAGGLVRWRFDALRPRDQLEAWLAHLMLCHAVASQRCAAMPRTLWLATDSTLLLDAVPDASAQLSTLLRLYRSGLVAPLPFHLRCAEVYVRRNGNLDAARSEWARSQPFPGEGHDPARQIAWRGVADPLGEDFEECARLVFSPLLQHSRQLRPWQALPEGAS